MTEKERLEILRRSMMSRMAGPMPLPVPWRQIERVERRG